MARLVAAGLSPEEIAAALPHIHVEPVSTAHPTEAKRATVIKHHRELYLLLVRRENQMWTPGEQDDIREQMKAVLERRGEPAKSTSKSPTSPPRSATSGTTS